MMLPLLAREWQWSHPHCDDQLLESAPDYMSRAHLLAAHTCDSGAWLNALQVSALGLRIDNDTVRVAIGLRLGAPLCLSHVCRYCEAEINDLGTHGFSCRKSQGCHPRHAIINSLIQRHLSAAGIPAHLESSRLCRSLGKSPDGVSIIPWSYGWVLVWDATCHGTLAPSHIALASREPGFVAVQAEQQKKAKYADLLATHHFVSIGIETTDVFGPEALSISKELGRRLRARSGEPFFFSHLLQQIATTTTHNTPGGTTTYITSNHISGTRQATTS